MNNENQYSEIWNLAKTQYENNPIAHAIVKGLANSVDRQIDRDFIMATIGHWSMLDILIAGELKIKETIRKDQLETTKILYLLRDHNDKDFIAVELPKTSENLNG